MSTSEDSNSTGNNDVPQEINDVLPGHDEDNEEADVDDSSSGIESAFNSDSDDVGEAEIRVEISYVGKNTNVYTVGEIFVDFDGAETHFRDPFTQGQQHHIFHFKRDIRADVRSFLIDQYDNDKVLRTISLEDLRNKSIALDLI